MSTSLADQLRRLKAPQTTLLVDSKSKASIIFEKKEAAKKDRKTIFDLGQSGLSELIFLNSTFAQFEQTLFNSNTIDLERSVEDGNVNKLLNLAIKKFFFHLSPYLLLQPAHLCLEWLIRRFHIHEFNKDELIDLILPYHETKIFIKCLQLISLHETNGKWDWLNATKKAGVPLSKTALQNRAANDNIFLELICNSTIQSIKELDNRSNTLQTKINFYCITVVGALEITKKVTESHISILLRPILKGFSSNSLDFTASSFMITAELLSKVNLKYDTLEVIISKMCGVEHKSLQLDIILLLILIYQTQNISEFPKQFLLNLITKKSVAANINELCKRKVMVSSFCVPLIKASFLKIHSKDVEWMKCKDFLTHLLNEVQFPEHEAKIIIKSILENNQYSKKKFKKDEIVELDSDDEVELLQEDIQKLYSTYLHQLEKQYPVSFDWVIKETMQNQNNISMKRKQALKSILAFRLKSSYCEDSSSIYENLYHSNYVNRIAAIKYLSENINALTKTEEGKVMIKDCILDRLSDDNHEVVTEVLKISSDNVLKIVDNKIFLEKLIEIFNKCHLQSDIWSSVKLLAIEHITSEELVKACDVNKIFFILLPFIVSDDQDDLKLLKNISKKEFVKYIPVLKEYFSMNLHKSSKTIKDFKNIINQIDNIPKPESILNTFEDVNNAFYYNSVNCTFVLLLLDYSYAKYETTDIQTKIRGFKIFENIDKHMKFVSHRDQYLQNIKPKKMCLSIALNFLLSLSKGIKIVTKKFTNTSENSKLLMKIFKIIISKSLSVKDVPLKTEYSISLQNLLKQTFQSSIEKLEYFSYYFIYDKINENITDYIFQIRAIKLFNSILNGSIRDNFVINRNILIKVILGLNSAESVIRQITIDTLHNISKLNVIVNADDISIINKILPYKQEILMDEIQITIVLHTIIFPSSSSNKQDNIIARDFLNSLLLILNDKEEELFYKVVILNIMKLANNAMILDNLIGLGCNLLEEAKLNMEKSRIGFDIYTAEIYTSIVERFDVDTILIIEKNEKCWHFLSSSLKNHNILIYTKGKIQSIATVVMRIFEAELYSKLDNTYKEKLLRYILDAMSTAEENSVSVTGSKLIKRLQIDGSHLKNILIEMKTLCSKTNIDSGHQSFLSNVNSLSNIKWKVGITLLELLQNMKNIDNYVLLIPILFDLLKKCLEFEEQLALDYAKQLILSCLINLCEKVHSFDIKSRSNLKGSALKMDLVVQCIRSTQNPQTHHHALMLLSQCAFIVPQQILHNITDVFTFMGSSVVRYDDSFSFQIIFNLIESVIPMLVQACNIDEKGENNQDKNVIPILKVFSDIILDVPEHRRFLLYTKLIRTLNAQQYLWMFLCTLFESHVINDEKDRQVKAKKNLRETNIRSASPEELSKRICIALQLCKDFEPIILLETCISLFTYLKKLPEEKQNETIEMVIDADEFEKFIFDSNSHTAKQLRHYKFTILQFISSLTSSPDFENAIANLNEEETKEMKTYYQNFIIKILSFIPSVTTAVDKNANTNQHKYWKIILHHCTDILENSISLLSADMLLMVVHGLIQHQISVVRKRVIELLINKLQYKTDEFENCKEDNLFNLLTPLRNIIISILKEEPIEVKINSNNDDVIIQHLALIAVKLLSRTLALKYVEEFKEILNLLSIILKKKQYVSKIITAAVVLAISEISSNLKAHSISSFHKFMPHMIEVLNDQAEIIKQQAPDNITIAVITGVYKLYDSLPLFLGPYYVDTFTLLIKIWIKLANRTSDNYTTTIHNKLNTMWTKIASSISLRILIPHCEKVYTQLLEEQNYKGVIYLMKLLNESFNNCEENDINIMKNDLTKFFLNVLDFRTNINTYIDINEINEIEEQILETFVSLILKLSENSFRPLYHKLYDWAIRSTQNDEYKTLNRAITYFFLSSKIAESLKSLFVLFASDFIQDAATLLEKCNKKLENIDEMTESVVQFKDNSKCVILLESIFKTLYSIFSYDTQGFVNAHRFDILMQPIVNQIENPLVVKNKNLEVLLINCIAQLTLVISNDVLWKQLNYEILLKTRNNEAEIKIFAIQACVEIAKKLGEDFSTLLPEAIPFMAELLEDENQIVEKYTRKAIQEVEKVVGETLQKYF